MVKLSVFCRGVILKKSFLTIRRRFLKIRRISNFVHLEKASSTSTTVLTSARGIMERKLNLFSDKGNPFTLKVLAASLVFDVPVEFQVVNKHEFLLEGISIKQLPILQCGSGKILFGANAASCYLFDVSQSLPLSSVEKHDEVVEWENQKLQVVALPLLASLVQGKQQVDCRIIEPMVQTVDGLLKDQKYLFGDMLTPADILVWSTMYGLMLDERVKELGQRYGAFSTWFKTVSLLDSTRKAVDLVTCGNGLTSFKSFFESYVLPSYIAKQKSVGENASEEKEGATEAELKSAMKNWLKGREGQPIPRKYVHPILPQEHEKNILVTASLPYVNNVPHLGNIIGCILSADVYARYCRCRNYNVIYITGTDEYGTTTESKAVSEGVTPQEICDKYYKLHKEVYDWFNVEYDCFGRTTNEHQTKIVQDLFWQIHKNGYIIEDTVEQLKCEKCNKVLADRFVEGICPLCSYQDARGDQCDSCGKLINAVELKQPRCKQCGSSPSLINSQHLFLDLQKLQPRLEEWLKETETQGDIWTANARSITKGWLAEGLKPRCITRDIKWGTPVPMEGYTDKVFYVWFDATIGYMSITAGYTDKWEQWWKNSKKVTLVQFMAKDNIPFHTVVFPSSLIAADDKHTLLSMISSTEYLNYEDDKFSKSRGVGVFGDQAKTTGIPADIFRFYLLYVRPESQDSSFQWDDMILKHNSELLNNMGNFINRALMFLKNNFHSIIPAMDLNDDDYLFLASVNRDLIAYVQQLERMKLRDGLRLVLNISRSGNQYMQTHKPWNLIKGEVEDRSRAGTVIGLATNVSALLALLIQPYMPEISKQIQAQLSLPQDRLVIPDHFAPLLEAGHRIGTPSPLFQKLEASFGEMIKKRFSGVKSQTPHPETSEIHTPATTATTTDAANVADLEAEVAKQGGIVRNAKANKHPKEQIDMEVKKLLALKEKLDMAQGKLPSDASKSKKKTGKKKKK